jgi:hypothetical protein
MAAINILYQQGGGSQAIDLVQQMPESKYQATKRTAIRYMKANYVAPGAVDLFEQLPFSLWQATNDFGDDVEVLYMKVPMQLYVEIEDGVGIWERMSIEGMPEIAHAYKVAGHDLRFVAVQLDDSEAVENVAAPTLTTTSGIVEEALRHAEPSSGLTAQQADLIGSIRRSRAILNLSVRNLELS